MRKLFFGMLAIVAMIATSCQQEADLGVNAGETATVSFNVNAPASRAYSDGTSATVLQYAVYDADGAYLPDLTKTTTINKTAQVELQLVTGNTYSVIFWADHADAPYTVDFAHKTMTVDYTGVLSNNEKLDAFYAIHEFTVKGAQTETIELRRPFAQLNIGTNDYTKATSAGYTPTQSSVKVTNIYNTLNLWDGTVDGETEVTFGYAAIKKDEKFPVDGYEYLAMNYLLVNGKENIDVEFTYVNDANDAKTRTVGSVPVQRNHRTNLYGAILTSDVAINVEIKPEYEEPDNDKEAVFASTQNQLVEALASNNNVVLTAGTYTMPAGNKFTAETVLTCEEGVVFEGTSGLNINGATIVGATFKNEDGIAVSGTINGTLKNCTFEGEEALRWCYTEAGKTVVFENCVINNDFRGFHFDDMKGDVLFKNCHINGFNAYGGEGTATFEGCTFGTDDRSRYNGLNIYANTVLTDCTFIYKSGKTNFIDMEATGKTLTITNCTATLDGAAANVADYVGGSKLPECTVTIDGEPVAVVGFTTVNGYSKLWVNADKSEYTVFSAEGLIQMHDYWAANASSNHMWGKTYSIGADIDATGHTWNSVYVVVGNNANNGFVIDGKGHTISNLAINGSLFTGTPNGGNADTTPGVVRNLTFDNATVSNGGFGAAVIWGNTYGEITFEDVHIVNSSVTGVCNVAAFVGATSIDSGTIDPIKFINCSVEKCTITAIGGDGCDPTGASGYVGRAFAKTSIVFEGTNTIDAATVLNNADGLASGRVYNYTTWANGGFSGTGTSDDFVNWNGIN